MPGPRKNPLPALGVKFAIMSAQGADRQELMKELFGIDNVRTADPDAVNRADVQMSRWRHHKDFDKIYFEEVKLTLKGISGRAVRVLSNQLAKDDVPWLQNKAANDILQQTKQAMFGEDERTITVKIEGAPELGEPDQEE